MHLSTIIIGDEVKSRPRFTNCQTFNIRLPDIKCLFNSPEVRMGEVRCSQKSLAPLPPRTPSAASRTHLPDKAIHRHCGQTIRRQNGRLGPRRYGIREL